MIVIGLTGGIGMGKSTIAKQFAALGAKTISADACVHELLAKDGAAVAEVKKYLPTVGIPSPLGGWLGRGQSCSDKASGAPLLASPLLGEEYVDRKALGAIVFNNKEKLKLLENILHPLVQQMEDDFIRRARILSAKIVVLDIPLLFETNGHERVDITVVASAPAFIQKQRVLVRKNMTTEKFERIIASQMQDLEKRKIADFVIPTGLGKAYSFKIVKELLTIIKE